MPAKIITIFNQKGGCAKTMTAMQLAGSLGLNGLKVFVIDMDPQNTASLWFHQAKPEHPFPAEVLSLSVLKENFLDKLEPLIVKADVILIDCPPSVESRVPWFSLMASDLALIPVIPLLDNIWASKQAEQLVLEARQMRASKGIKTELQAAYVLSMVRRGKVLESCEEALKKAANVTILKSKMSMRNAYPECQLYGCVVTSFGQSEATRELNSLTKEVAGKLGLKLSIKK